MKKPKIQCTFCGKSRPESGKMIVGDSSAICANCISEFTNLLKDNLSKARNITENITDKALKAVEEIKKEQLDDKKKAFSNMLDSMKLREFLDKHVIGQDSAKKALSVSIVNHYKRMLYESEIDKSNVLITGPSGSGKSLLVRTIAKYLNVPFLAMDATTLTEAGYIGENVDTILSRLLAAAGGDVEIAQHGIIFLDEIDKVAINKNRGNTENRMSGIQSALLKMVEGAVVRVPLSNKKMMMPQMTEIDTRNILFICGGSFVGLKDIVTARLKKKKGIGFTDVPETISGDLSSEYTTEDFIEFGMIPEFVGRFPFKVHTQELTKAELIKILTEPENNILDEFKFYFGVDHIDLEFTPEFIEKIAEAAKKEKTGARSLRGICDAIMLNHLYLLPAYKSQNTAKLTFTGDCFDTNVLPMVGVYENEKTKNS